MSLHRYGLCFDVLLQSTIEQVCRLARMIASPHDEASHFYLMAEGCPSRATTIATLAAHVAGFRIFKLRCASSTDSSPGEHLQHFKADLVRLYLRAGVKVRPLNFCCKFRLSTVENETL